MIFLLRPKAPASLTNVVVVELTAEFQSNKAKRVWDIKHVREALLFMSHNKCVYCEAYLGEKSQYMEIDHFLNKGRYPEFVIDWENLLPSCKHCNTSKRDHDAVACPMVNPTKTDPRIDLAIVNYRFRSKTNIGQTTIDVLNLNDNKRNVQPRFHVGDRLAQYAEELEDLCRIYESSKITRDRNKLLRKLRGALREAGPESEYSAIAATTLLNDRHFQASLVMVKAFGFWDVELQHLYDEANQIRY